MNRREGLENKVQRLPIRLSASAERTITRFFWTGDDRARKILGRVEGLADSEVDSLLGEVLDNFGGLHPDLREILTEHCQKAMSQIGVAQTHSPSRQLLIGAYFTMEYAHESAALFNPSMVPARDQSGLPPGSTRFIMSLRAVGEGHISSIVFRQGVIDKDWQISFDSAGAALHRLRRVEGRSYDTSTVREHLKETGLYSQSVEQVLGRLGGRFTLPDLMNAAQAQEQQSADRPAFRESIDRVLWLASSTYEIEIPARQGIGELVLFPISEAESQGMEDMRLVRFTDAEGSHRYYGTYTAYNGSRILPQLMVSAHPGKVAVHSLHGSFARNKGLALFPRQIDGQYLMIGRCDAENLYLLRSSSVFNWNEGQILQIPKNPWEFVQIGNCGSPIETEAGWLVLTHGVGPMRRYCIGAMLLDLKDPSKVIGQLPEPLMVPMKDERIGYVPNVVYSCGAMIHNDVLVIPYGISDAASGFATIGLKDLLGALTAK